MCRLCTDLDAWTEARAASELHALLILDSDDEQARVRCSCGVDFNCSPDPLVNMKLVDVELRPWCPVATAEEQMRTDTANRIAQHIETSARAEGQRARRSLIEERLKVAAEVRRGDWL